MPTKYRKKSLKQGRNLITLAVFFSLAGLITAIGFARPHTKSNVTAEPLLSTPDIPAERVPGGERPEQRLITIRATGFEPAEIKRASGPFLLAIDNRSGLDEVTLRLTREGGSQVREIHLAPGRLKWREKVNLPSGNYSLNAPSHPNWVCRITIAP